MNISVNYAAPWDKRYWAKDYADEALSILTRSSRWPAGSLVVEHTDPQAHPLACGIYQRRSATRMVILPGKLDFWLV